MANENLLQCYNRGCGQKFDPNKNNDGKNFYSFQKKVENHNLPTIDLSIISVYLFSFSHV